MAAPTPPEEPAHRADAALQNECADAIDRLLYGPDYSRKNAQDALGDATAHFAAEDGPASGGDGGRSAGAADSLEAGTARRTAVRQALLAWSRVQGLVVARMPWELDGPLDIGGGEHHVFAGQRYVKITNRKFGDFGAAPMVGRYGLSLRPATLQEYLRRLRAQNEELGDDVRLHGVWDDERGRGRIITSQPAVVGNPVGDADIVRHMVGSGFEQLTEAGWYYRRPDNLLITDLTSRNAVAHAGELFPFDAHVSHPEGKLRDAVLQNLDRIRKPF